MKNLLFAIFAVFLINVNAWAIKQGACPLELNLSSLEIVDVGTPKELLKGHSPEDVSNKFEVFSTLEARLLLRKQEESGRCLYNLRAEAQPILVTRSGAQLKIRLEKVTVSGSASISGNTKKATLSLIPNYDPQSADEGMFVGSGSEYLGYTFKNQINLTSNEDQTITGYSYQHEYRQVIVLPTGHYKLRVQIPSLSLGEKLLHRIAQDSPQGLDPKESPWKSKLEEIPWKKLPKKVEDALERELELRQKLVGEEYVVLDDNNSKPVKVINDKKVIGYVVPILYFNAESEEGGVASFGVDLYFDAEGKLITTVEWF